ncbi:MAG: hypothetical protein N3F05_04860 [Candidatus Diapherotrites archaeon]|nr:hypothetical protein [Candidatus Diapherotrites archaeon]
MARSWISWHLVLLCFLATSLLGIANAQLIEFTLEPNILQSKEITLNYGQPIEIRAELSGPKLVEAQNITMKMTIAETATEKYFTKLSHNSYLLRTTLPDNKYYEKILVQFELKAYIDKEISVKRWLNIKLTNELMVDIVEPSGSIFGTGEIKEIKARLRYYNTMPFDKERVFANVIVDNGMEKKVEFIKDGEFYTAVLPEAIPEGSHDIKLALIGNYRGSASVKTNPNIVLPLFLLLAISVFSVFMIRRLIRQMRESNTKKTTEEIKQEQKETESTKTHEKTNLFKIVLPPIRKGETATQQKKDEALVPRQEKRIEEFVIEKPKPKYEVPIQKKEVAEIVEVKKAPESELKMQQKKESEPELPKEEKERKSSLFPLFMPKKKQE